jgi:DNA polymerase III subunit gamma/tau
VATTALYRRYRPRRFAELKGQDHVVRALRDAVAGGREGQAYLFSGPRGTGKTSSARILAKVLNCERPVDGEPCCECVSCLAVERGTSYDVHELDAASNNGVDAMRDLIERASLGTPGRHKVYILDEVHMLSKAAEAALLKTLEEPPPHVVFVLATTDPQRVSDTIRSRTQHLRFHLLPAETLAEHVRWVVADAGLDLSDEAIDAALAQGGGSARDTLSALELIASAGAEAGETLSFDEFIEAFIEHDPGRALAAMAAAVNAGHEPRTLAEALIRHLRNEFLSLMAPELVQVSQHQVDELAAQARRLGPGRIVRGIERLGEIVVELRHAPDPRVLVEVALVQLSSDPGAAGDDIGALAARVTKLEQAAAAGPPAATAPGPVDPTTGRAALGGRARAQDTAAASTAPPPLAPPPVPVSTAAPSSVDLTREWESQVCPSLKGMARALFTPVDVVGGDGATVTIAVPNATHRTKCEQHRSEVERAWSAATGRAVRIELVVGDGAGDDQPAVASPLAPASYDEVEPLDDGPAAAMPSAIERLAQAFPGAELVEGRE